MGNYIEELDKALNDPEVHFVAKAMLNALDKRDPVDALYNAEMVFKLMRLRCVEVAERKSFKQSKLKNRLDEIINKDRNEQ